jgi:hypothetical protein
MENASIENIRSKGDFSRDVYAYMGAMIAPAFLKVGKSWKSAIVAGSQPFGRSFLTSSRTMHII